MNDVGMKKTAWWLTAVGVVGHSDDSHGLVRDVGAENFGVSSCIFAGTQDGSPHSIRPEDVLIIHSQAEESAWARLDNDLKFKSAQEKQERKAPSLNVKVLKCKLRLPSLLDKKHLILLYLQHLGK